MYKRSTLMMITIMKGWIVPLWIRGRAVVVIPFYIPFQRVQEANLLASKW